MILFENLKIALNYTLFSRDLLTFLNFWGKGWGRGNLSHLIAQVSMDCL